MVEARRTGIDAMRRIGEIYAAEEGMREIGRLVLDEVGQQLIEDVPQLREGLIRGLPVPVLSVSKANHLETPWTEYLAYMLDPLRSGAIGETLGPLVFAHLSGREIAAKELRVLCEVSLGNSRCDDCSRTHHCVIDLVLASLHHVVAIEQKVTSGPSDWTCACGRQFRQLQEYASLVPAWVRREHKRFFPHAETTPHTTCHYLTLGGMQAGAPWRAVSHQELSRCAIAALERLPGQAGRSSLAAMIMDWNSSPFGDWPQAVEQLAIVLDRCGTKPTITDSLWYLDFIENSRDLRQFIMHWRD